MSVEWKVRQLADLTYPISVPEKPFTNNCTAGNLNVFERHAKTFAKKCVKNDWKRYFVKQKACGLHIKSPHNEGERTDNNLEDRIGKFGLQIDEKHVYRMPLKYFSDLGQNKLLNKKWHENSSDARNRNEKTVWIKKKVMTIGVPDAQIVFRKAPYLQYEQILLTKNFRQDLETILLSSKS